MKKIKELITIVKKNLPCFIMKKKYIIDRMKTISEIPVTSVNFMNYRVQYNSWTKVIITDQVNAHNQNNSRYLVYTITSPENKISIRVKYEDGSVNVYFDKVSKATKTRLSNEILNRGKVNIESEVNYRLTRFLYRTIKAIG